MFILRLVFPRPVVDFKLTEEDNGEEAHVWHFLRNGKRKKKRYGQKALADMKKRKRSKKENGGTVSGPFRLGTPIKQDEPIMEIQHIQDEERRVTIEGYVFDTEVRELRSGRSLLDD